MHVVFRESHGLEEADTPMDLGQTPGIWLYCPSRTVTLALLRQAGIVAAVPKGVCPRCGWQIWPH